MKSFTTVKRLRNSSSRPAGTSKQLMYLTMSSPFIVSCDRSLHVCAMTAHRYTDPVPSRQAPDPEPPTAADGAASGRAAQRRRTRNAIVSATRELIAAGKTPSIDDIAAAADVSRRTIYMYFPTVDQLVLDATAGLLS